MHYFKTEGILLSKKKMTEKELLYKIFFKDYGILNVKKLKKTREKELDTGYIIGCEIITHDSKKNTLPSITNIKIKEFFNPEGKKHNEIVDFLSSIAYVDKSLPVGFPHSEIYELAVFMISNQNYITSTSYILFRLKLRSYNGELQLEHNNINVQKILKFVHKESYKDLLRLKQIPEEIYLILKTLY